MPARRARPTGVDGYRAHLEVEPSAGLNRQCELTMAAGDANHDAAVAARMLATHDEPVCGYGDSAYDTGELRAALAAANCAAVIRRRRSGRRFRRVHHRPLRRGRDGRHLHLPGRITRAITPGRSVNFGIACRDCLLHDRARHAAARRLPRLKHRLGPDSRLPG